MHGDNSMLHNYTTNSSQINIDNNHEMDQTICTMKQFDDAKIRINEEER